MVTVEVSNPTNETERSLIELRIDGELVATKGVRVAAGDSETVTFERTFRRPGTREIVVDDTEFPAFSVVASTDSPELEPAEPARTEASVSGPVATDAGNAEMVDASGLADWIREGFNASVRVTLANDGDNPVRDTVQVTVDGQPVASETVVVPGSSRITESVEFRAVAGTVRVNGTEVGTLSVGQSFEEAEPQATTGGGGPGFGFVTGALAVFAALIAAVANRPDRRQGE